MAPALRVLNIPFLALGILLLGRAWYLELKQTDHWRGFWAERSRKILVASTLVSVVIWGLRFGGLLGMRPF
ncbi:MAG: hypothetical protein IH867_06145 [Chloroflexi bacterium]|nr:hypothetical protein [Chloroflexota bacterium]